MACDTQLADRIEQHLKSVDKFDRRKMFGGVGFLLNGNMCCGVWRDFMILRLGDEAGSALLDKPHVRPFDITGRPMQGWAMVSSEGVQNDIQLEAWIQKAYGYVKTLPPK